MEFFTSDYYLQYLEDIDAGAHTVTKWELGFLEDMLKHRPRILTQGQTEVVRKMVKQYLREEI